MQLRSIDRLHLSLLLVHICGGCLTSLAQDGVVGTLDREKITAGQHFKLTVHFLTAPSYVGYLQDYFDYQPVSNIQLQQAPAEISCSADTKPGERDVELDCSVPLDADGGVYRSQRLRIGPAPGGTRQRMEKLTVPDVEVVPVQDTNTYPSDGVATLDLTQRQVLESGAAKVEVLLDQLNTKVDSHSAETPELRDYLAAVAQDAQNALEKSRSDYSKAVPKGSSEPIFFEDFRRLYADFLIDDKAPQAASIPLQYGNEAHFELAQLQENETVTVRPDSLSNSLGPLVTKLAAILGNHVAAFLKIGESGATEFTISLRSSPPGASVSYKRIGEDYQDYSKVTDIEKATFPYALWTFRFSLGKCEVVKTPNPYIEKSPNLDPAMQNCLKK